MNTNSSVDGKHKRIVKNEGHGSPQHSVSECPTVDNRRLPLLGGDLLQHCATDYETIAAIPEPQETLHRFGEHLLHTPVLIDDTPWQTTDPRTCDRDALARLLDTGARIAIPTMQPRELYRVFDELQIDPAQTQIDVYAEPADTLLASARSYAAAREMHEELASQ